MDWKMNPTQASAFPVQGMKVGAELYPGVAPVGETALMAVPGTMRPVPKLESITPDQVPVWYPSPGIHKTTEGMNWLGSRGEPARVVTPSCAESAVAPALPVSVTITS